MSSANNWYLIHSKPRQEQIALRNLERQSYRTYLPMVNVKRLRQKGYQVVAEPMFSRYLFIELNQQVDWSPIRSTRGVANIVRFGTKPARVSDEFVQALQLNVCQNNEMHVDESLFVEGEHVNILQGPFAGYEAIFQQEKGTDRAVILLEMADRYTRIDIEKHALQKVH